MEDVPAALPEMSKLSDEAVVGKLATQSHAQVILGIGGRVSLWKWSFPGREVTSGDPDAYRQKRAVTKTD
jgi:hypothetical protein